MHVFSDISNSHSISRSPGSISFISRQLPELKRHGLAISAARRLSSIGPRLLLLLAGGFGGSATEQRRSWTAPVAGW